MYNTFFFIETFCSIKYFYTKFYFTLDDTNTIFHYDERIQLQLYIITCGSTRSGAKLVYQEIDLEKFREDKIS